MVYELGLLGQIKHKKRHHNLKETKTKKKIKIFVIQGFVRIYVSILEYGYFCQKKKKKENILQHMRQM